MSIDRLYKAQMRFLFHAHIKIKISVFYDDSVFDTLFAVLEDVDRYYNSYRQGSYIDQINKSPGCFVYVNDETVKILKEVIFLSGFFDGTYDITIMPLIRLWGFYKEDQWNVPSRQEIEGVKQLVDYRKIEITDNKVRIAEGQEIITGSFIKAYAVDKLIEKMKEMGISDAIINAGGSTIYALNDEAHPSWKVTAGNPDDESLLFDLNIANCCYSTSSQSKTHINIEGKQYGHILNPVTGYPSFNKQVGIVSDSCMVGDIVSTGLFNETPRGFLKKMDSLSEYYKLEGYIMDEGGRVACTEGFSYYHN
ncbi:hypothetical protein FACS1894179_08190 [Bacteroidia bacterium]|nr:hypothetical protein FACS1894179_08190 [Bacteroidia bacterium]